VGSGAYALLGELLVGGLAGLVLAKQVRRPVLVEDPRAAENGLAQRCISKDTCTVVWRGRRRGRPHSWMRMVTSSTRMWNLSRT
jgi:hypothetical protein